MPHHLTILTGHSRGLGLAMAQALLQAQHQLLGLARQPVPALQDAAQAAGVPLTQWSVDLQDPGPVAERLQRWLAAQDPAQCLSVTLINNAALIPPIAPLAQTDGEALAKALRVGLEAPLRLSASVLAATEGWAVPRRVLNISSGLGRRAMASQSVYCAIKAGLDHATRCLALEEALKPHGARVCSLAPGVIDTDMQVQLRSADQALFPDRVNFANLHAKGQLSAPAEAAARVLAWLARPDFGQEPIADVRQA
ncbi:MAG: SDR family NAD(P)-dependent oxidoreductase [Limnohabitans sp.]